jgi:hypothetical protein
MQNYVVIQSKYTADQGMLCRLNNNAAHLISYTEVATGDLETLTLTAHILNSYDNGVKP